MQTTQPLPAVTIGELLAGKYRVDGKLGEGGMGVVVAATNIALGTRVAIKLLRPSALADRETLGRFEREARAAASLKSEHVARAIDVGKLADGRPYLVMEHLEGQDLSAVIDAPAVLSVHDGVDFVLQACEAIAEAHAAGIIHRDLKPKNLFLTKTVDGRPLVKVLDFGISKIEGPAEEMQLTRTTEVIGSPSYMSPEQLRASRDVDPRTDVWALGVILYELLTKKLPFYANTVTELVAVVLMEQHLPVRVHRPDAPEPLDWVVSRCLAKRPDDRFSTVGELAHHLRAFASDAGASIADRVVGVERQSGRLSGQLPPITGPYPVPGAGSSSRVSAHVSTTTAWGETQVEPPRATLRPASRAPVVVAAGALLVIVAAGAASGAVWYVKRADARAVSGSPTAPPSAEPLPLPPGRKDLPPLSPSATDGKQATAAAPVGAPSAQGDPAPSAQAQKRQRPTPAGTGPSPTPRPTASVTDDPLSNIGRK